MKNEDLLKPKKSLGQNYFINKNLAKKISEYIATENPDLIIEIGPGRGVFTYLLIPYAPIIGIEIFQNSYNFLTVLPELEGAEFINEDVLALTEAKLDSFTSNRKSCVIFGSLPYNQSKKIIKKFLIWGGAEKLFFIIQKEVALKYQSKNGSNRLSAFSEVYADYEILEKIGPESFHPKPKVQSRFVKFSLKKEPLIDKKVNKNYEIFINECFSNPRKKLSNNIPENKSILIREDEKLRDLLELRPHEISTENFVKLFTATS